MCFVNTVLQLLVNCPPFWNQFRDLGQLMGQLGHRNSQQAGGGTTVLVDATVRLLDEFVEEKPHPTLQTLQLVEKGKAREDEKEKKEADDTDPFIPTYLYDAMKEKSQFKNMLVRFCAHTAPFCY
jgi:ubiquitin carboxyl-terminal hydrolase 10